MRLISFDLDGTLVDFTYTSWIWEKEIPQLYAQINDLPPSQAVQVVTAEYKRVGDAARSWYDIAYWFDYFGLPGSWRQVMESHQEKIQPFPEVKAVIENLGQDHVLIINSNAAREFMELELKVSGLSDYFARTFSATSDFGEVKSTCAYYQRLCEALEIRPDQMIHVGDHYQFDFLIPTTLGIQAYYLDRSRSSPEGPFTVSNLRDFSMRIRRIRTSAPPIPPPGHRWGSKRGSIDFLRNGCGSCNYRTGRGIFPREGRWGDPLCLSKNVKLDDRQSFQR